MVPKKYLIRAISVPFFGPAVQCMLLAGRGPAWLDESGSLEMRDTSVARRNMYYEVCTVM